jgi:GNAT superfamily N-acetyltransferase
MSADEHLSPVQFSHHPGGAFPGEPNYPHVAASVGGKRVGELVWATGYHHPFDNINGQIQDVQVDPEHRRKGIATGMLQYARGIDSSVKHSPDQTEDGQEWAESRP